MQRAGGLLGERHCRNVKNKTLIFQVWDEERDQGAVPWLWVQAVLEACVASLAARGWPGALLCDSMRGSSLTSKGAKHSVAEAGAHPDPRVIPAAVCERHTVTITLRGPDHPVRIPFYINPSA